MDAKIAEWLNWLQLTVSAKTLWSYEYHLRRLTATAPDRKPDEWTQAQLQDYLAMRREGGNGPAILKQMVAAFRSFFGYTIGEASPARRVPYPKQKRRIQRTLTGEEAVKLIAACDTSTALGVRDLAMIALMLDSGLRVSEVCRASVAKLNLEKRRLDVVVKGGNEESAIYSRLTADCLVRWLAIRGNHARPECGTLFVSIGGGRPGTKLTAAGLKAIVIKVGQRAELPHLTPHALRRTFATLAIKAGAPTRVVQAAGRWANVAMVELYTATIEAQDFDRYSPVEALFKRGDE